MEPLSDIFLSGCSLMVEYNSHHQSEPGTRTQGREISKKVKRLGEVYKIVELKELVVNIAWECGDRDLEPRRRKKLSFMRGKRDRSFMVTA